MSDPYVMTIPAVPPSFNEFKRWPWQKQERERKAFQKLVWAYLNEHGNRCPRDLQRVELRFAMTFKVARRRDSDNFGALLHKWTQDMLVRERVIPDDTHDRCTAYPPRIVVGETDQTVIVIKPLGVGA